MRPWPGRGPDDGRAGRDGNRREGKPPSGKPATSAWFAKSFATAIPALAAGGAGLVSTGSLTVGGVAGVAATAVTAATAPLVDSWFKGREIKAQEEAAAALAAREYSGYGAMSKALATLSAVYELIEDTLGHAGADGRSLEDARSQLAAVLGGGSAVPAQVQQTLGLNGEAQADLKDLVSGVGQAGTALRRFQKSIS